LNDLTRADAQEARGERKAHDWVRCCVSPAPVPRMHRKFATRRAARAA